jgi:trk system potassium uptake protein TrkA
MSIVAVIGLGRFGKSLALELMSEDTEVLGIDSNPKTVESVAGRLTHAVVADSTDAEALEQLSVQESDRAVVGIGTNLEASILTTSVLVEMGIPLIWAKAVSDSHARILQQIGAHHVVRPEHDMGLRVAHLVRGRMLDFIEFDDDYAMVKTAVPAYMVGKTLRESAVRHQYGVTIVAIKRPGAGFSYATPETRRRHTDRFRQDHRRGAVQRAHLMAFHGTSVLGTCVVSDRLNAGACHRNIPPPALRAVTTTAGFARHGGEFAAARPVRLTLIPAARTRKRSPDEHHHC